MQILKGGALVPTSQEGGNMVADNSLAMSAPGSVPVTPMPGAPNAVGGGGGDNAGQGMAGENLPLPQFDKLAPQLPVSTQPGNYGGVGLPPSRKTASDALRQPGGTGSPNGAGMSGITQPKSDGHFTCGNQTTGNQGAGNPGAGKSGDGTAWTATPSFRPPAWGSADTGS